MKLLCNVLLLVILWTLPSPALAQSSPRVLASPNEESGGAFGAAVGGLPDINGDGTADVVVGAYREDSFFGDRDAGQAYVFSGADGTVLFELSSLNTTVDGHFGVAVAGIGDVDQDDAADLVIGANGETSSASPDGAGRAYLISSSDGSVWHTLQSPNEEQDGRFGSAVAGVRDVNSDGRADVLIGAPQEDPSGSPSGAGRAYLFSGADGILLTTFISPDEQQFGRFGSAVAGVEDIDNDDVPDVLIGAEQEASSGRAYLFSGATGDLIHTLTSPNAQSGGRFGHAVSGLGDIDEDSRADLLVGADSEAPGNSLDRAGRAYIFSGADGSALHTLQSPNEEQDGFFGIAVASVGDGNGDGSPDALIGADGESGGASGAGRAYVFNGADGAAYFTLMSSNPESSGRFSASVAGAPRTDGRSDPIVGAPAEDPDASPDDAGRTYAFNGSVLPVELTHFQAQASGEGSVMLTWTTASETDNAGFEVERRLIGAGADRSFIRIGFVEGAGTTTEARQYRFRDDDLPPEAAHAAYRLKQIDRDGSTHHSEVVEVQLGAPAQFALHGNVPNPFRTRTTIRYDLPRAGKVRLAIYDMLGRRVATLVDESQTAGRKQVVLTAQHLASGVYLLRLKAAGQRAQQRITVVR